MNSADDLRSLTMEDWRYMKIPLALIKKIKERIIEKPKKDEIET